MNIIETSAESAEATELMEELSAYLERLTGSSGKKSFNAATMKDEKSVFIIAKDDGKNVGCGAISKIDNNTAELKRIYTRIRNNNYGKEILKYLERKAGILGYKKIVVETRKINEGAVNFYIHNGYSIIKNYGKYKGREEAICFEKKWDSITTTST
jgi:N-acetylglutamate synthase-like GNAT family acetyltransferase